MNMISFNTTIVSVELQKLTLDLQDINTKFQYNYCFGGTKFQGLYLEVIPICFNTTIVSVEHT